MRQAHIKKGVYWHIFPTYGEAKDAIWRDPAMLFSIIPPALIANKNEQELVIYFRNGSVLQLIGADEPDSLRGAGPMGVVFDEFAKIKYYAWQIVEPVLRANGGWAWFIGTPLGKNHLYDLYQLGQQNHKEWKSYLLKASKSGIIPIDQLMESKKISTQATWNQEWECEFLEGEGSVFRGVREIMTAEPHNPNTPEHENEIYVMGLDLAKVQDYTVISIFSRSTNQQVYRQKIKTIEWPFQKKIIYSVAKNFHNCLIYIDATGVGDPVADDLIRSGLSVEPYKFTEQSKKELIEKLAIWIEQKKIRLLPNEDALLEYDNFSYTLGPTGKLRYEARQGFHDDCVIADALAVWDLQPLYGQVNISMPTPLQIYKQKVFNSFEYEQSQGKQDDWSEWEETTDDHGF